MINIGTVGTSGICESFIEGLKLAGGYKLNAVYSRGEKTGKAFATKHNCDNVFTDLTKMAAWDGIDAVYIATPNLFHFEQSKLFLENGKNVICEKPITTNADEYIELKKIADNNKLIYMEAIIPIHTDHYRDVKAAVAAIGNITAAKLDFFQRSSRLDAFLRGEHVNIFDMSLHAGTLMDLGVYCVYAAVDLLGVPKNIYASAHYLKNGADGSGAALFEYDNFSATLSYSKICQGGTASEIIGEKGSVIIERVSQYAGVTLLKDGKETKVAGFFSKAELMSGEAKKFASYITDLAGYSKDYEKASDMCLSVHKCMDEIKRKAKIIYPK